MIISRTPYRISLFGGGSDYPHWYRQHGGSVLGFAIDKYCYLSVRPLPPLQRVCCRSDCRGSRIPSESHY